MSQHVVMGVLLCGGLLFVSSPASGQSWRSTSSTPKSSVVATTPVVPNQPTPPAGEVRAPAPLPMVAPPGTDGYTMAPSVATQPPLVGPIGYPSTAAPAYSTSSPLLSRLPTPPDTQPISAPGYRYVASDPTAQPQPLPPQAQPMTIDGVSPSPHGLCAEDCAPKACWVVSGDLLGLTRTGAKDQTLVKDCVDNCSVLDVHDLSFGYELGLRVNAMRLPGGCGGCIWEIGYMGLPDWSTSRGAAGNLIFCGPGFSLQVNPSQFVATYSSSFHSVEVNARPCQSALCGAPCSWFVGMRYIRLDESLVVSELVAPLPNVLDIHSQNNLFGGQMGTNILLMDRGGPFYLESTVKFGLFANDNSQVTASSLVGPAVRANSAELAFVGEFLFAAGYRVNSCFDLRVGYQVLGISGVALAPDQFQMSDLTAQTACVDPGQFIAHGAFLGGSYRW